MLLIDSGASISLVGPNNQTPVKLATAKLEEYLNRDGDASLSTEISSLESINVAFSKIHNSHRSQFLRTLGQRDVQKIEALLETIPVEILRPSFFHSVSQNGTNALLTGMYLMHNCLCYNANTTITAVKTRQPAIVRILLDKGANPAIQSTPASSPLHEAVSLGEYEIVAELLTSGALWQLKNRSGRTPLDHALVR
jgi:ankyrin repeat protein